MLELKIPRSGKEKRGSIESIKESNNGYYKVKRYGINSHQIVYKKKKNLNGLMDNYHDDLKKYLENTYPQYMRYKNILAEREKMGKLKSKVNTTKIKALIGAMLIATFVSATGLALLISNITVFTYLDMSLLCLSIVGLSASTNLLANNLKDKKKERFINEYNDYQTKVNEYNIKISKNKKHKYTFGDVVRVRCIRASKDTSMIDFELVGD